MGTVDKVHQRNVRDEWWQFCRQKLTGQQSETPDSFQSEDLAALLSKLKTGTAAGYDNILPEFLKHMGQRAREWLTSFFTRIVHEKRTPRVWRQAKIIAMPKPGKDHSIAGNYRPISLLSVCYKYLERLLLQCAIQGFIQTFVSGGEYETLRGRRSSGRRPRVEARSAEWEGSEEGVSPSPVWRSGGVTPGKILKLEA